MKATAEAKLTLNVQVQKETDGRWIGDALEVSGAMVYAADPGQALKKAIALALRVMAERIEHGEPTPFKVSSISL